MSKHRAINAEAIMRSGDSAVQSGFIRACVSPSVSLSVSPVSLSALDPSLEVNEWSSL